MECLRQIVLGGSLLGVLATVGCTSMQVARETVQQATQKVVETTSAPPAPATQMLTVWKSELQALPDPTRDGTMTYGLPGQIFLLTSNDTPAMAMGDVTVAVHDETDRPGGVPSPHKPEVWHITADVLQRCQTRDERLGLCYVVFLPWKPEWTDVKKIRVSTRYDVKDQPHLSLTSRDRKMVLEKQAMAVVNQAQRTDMRTVPNPNKILAQLQAGQPVTSPVAPPSSPPMTANPVYQAGNTNLAPAPATWPSSPTPAPAPPASYPTPAPTLPSVQPGSMPPMMTPEAFRPIIIPPRNQ